MEASVATAHIPGSGIVSMTFTTEDGESWAVEPSRYFFKTPHVEYMVVYRGSDVKDWPRVAEDARDLKHYPQASATRNDKAYVAVVNGQSCSIKLIADYELYNHFGKDYETTINYMVSIYLLSELL